MDGTDPSLAVLVRDIHANRSPSIRSLAKFGCRTWSATFATTCICLGSDPPPAEGQAEAELSATDV
jgi:hypothetical protein